MVAQPYRRCVSIVQAQAAAVKIDRDFYTIGDALRLIADELAPIPDGPLTALTSRELNLGVYPPTLEELKHKTVRDKAFIRLQKMIVSDTIRPLDWVGTYPLQWEAYASPSDVAHFRISAADFRQLCDQMPVAITMAEPALAPAATHRPEVGEERKRVMREMRERGDSDKAIGTAFAVSRQRVGQEIGTKAANRVTERSKSRK